MFLQFGKKYAKDYDRIELGKNLYKLLEEIIADVPAESTRQKIKEQIEYILNTKAISKNENQENLTYRDILSERQVKLSKVVRFIQNDDSSSISRKTADFSIQSIQDLISQGEKDVRNTQLD